MRKKANDAKIARETEGLRDILALLPDNPVAWANVIRLVAPILARLAVRMALKRLNKSLGEEKVNAIGSQVGAIIRGIVEPKEPPKSSSAG